MKRHFVLFVILVSVCAAGFSGERDGNSSGEKSTEPHEFSVLDINFLEHVPGLLNFTSYQNQQGEALSYKEVNAMLLSVPDNEQFMRRHHFWRGTALTFAGILLASVATDVAYTLGDDLPQETAVMTAASAAGAGSIFCALLSGYISTSHYLKAVDNYNEQLLRMLGQ